MKPSERATAATDTPEASAAEAADVSAGDAFEVYMFGGTVERRFRRMRPELESLPWGQLAARQLPEDLRERSRAVWTEAAYVEHRSAAWIASSVTLMLAARAPMDLVALASRYVADELSHVDLCARILAELGGGIAIPFDPIGHDPRPLDELSPLLRATEMAVRVFCMGETFSLTMAQHAARATADPLVSAVIRRIAKDEAPHARLGWDYLDWAEPLLGESDREYLDGVIRETLAWYESTFDPGDDAIEEPTLGWLCPKKVDGFGRRALEDDIVRPLRARGLLG